MQAPAASRRNESAATLPFLPWGSITLIVKLRVTVNCGVNYRPLLCCRNTRGDCGGPRGCRCVATRGRVRAGLVKRRRRASGSAFRPSSISHENSAEARHPSARDQPPNPPATSPPSPPLSAPFVFPRRAVARARGIRRHGSR